MIANKPITIEELRTKREVLESNIKNLINGFQAETGVALGNVYVTYINGFGKDHLAFNVSVEISL